MSPADLFQFPAGNPPSGSEPSEEIPAACSSTVSSLGDVRAALTWIELRCPYCYSRILTAQEWTAKWGVPKCKTYDCQGGK